MVVRASAKVNFTLRDAEVLFDESDNAAEIVPVVVDQPLRREWGNHDQGNAESQLVASKGPSKNGGWVMIIPSAQSSQVMKMAVVSQKLLSSGFLQDWARAWQQYSVKCASD